jgi:hypothetical protein
VNRGILAFSTIYQKVWLNYAASRRDVERTPSLIMYGVQAPHKNPLSSVVYLELNDFSFYEWFNLIFIGGVSL